MSKHLQFSPLYDMVLSSFEHICTFIPTELITYFKISIKKS
jgi:hypothetical protein